MSASFHRSSSPCCSHKNVGESGWISTWSAFCFGFPKCIFRNFADLLGFMLHRALSIGSVKIMCCRFGFPHTLRGELTCGSFQLYIWRLNLLHTLSFGSPFQNRLVLTFTEEIILQSEPGKQDENQISEKIFYNVSNSELKFFTTSQILTKNIILKNRISRKKILSKNPKKFYKAGFGKVFTHKYQVLIQFTTCNGKILRFTCIFKKHDFEESFFSEKQDFDCKILSKKHDFQWKIFVKSMISNEIFSTCQILIQNFSVSSDFEIDFLQRVGF